MFEWEYEGEVAEVKCHGLEATFLGESATAPGYLGFLVVAWGKLGGI